MRIVKGLLIGSGILTGIILLSIIVIILLPESKQFKYPVNEDGIMALDHSVEINATPDKIWRFFLNIEKNYATWHSDHVVWKWTKGAPFEKGSTLYSEQYFGGELAQYEGEITESIPKKKIVITFSFPISIMLPKIEWIITDKGQSSIFTAITYMKINKVFRTVFRKQVEKMIQDHDQHVAKEGEILKMILERKG